MQKSVLQTVLPDPREESFVMCSVGRRGSGKTTLICKLLHSKNGFKGKFDKIVIISPTFYLAPQWKSFDSSSWDVYTKYDPEIVEELLTQQSGTWRLRKRPKILLILDDLGKTSRLLKKNQHDPLDTLACNGRHVDISVVFIGQQFSQMNTAIRSNADITIFFASHNLRDNLDLYNESGTGDYKSFRDKVKQITEKKYSFFLVKNCGGRLKYHANFQEVSMK
jgi:hypothetical protein